MGLHEGKLSQYSDYATGRTTGFRFLGEASIFLFATPFKPLGTFLFMTACHLGSREEMASEGQEPTGH
jgi:hypothetical protein